MLRARISRRAYAVLAVGLCSCAARVPAIVLEAPWLDHPIEQGVADQVKAGMGGQDVIRIAGQAGAAGGVAPAPPAFGPDAYSVFCDVGMTPDWDNSTWIYAIIADRTTPANAPDRLLFVEMKAGIVVRVYQGRLATWTM